MENRLGTSTRRHRNRSVGHLACRKAAASCPADHARDRKAGTELPAPLRTPGGRMPALYGRQDARRYRAANAPLTLSINLLCFRHSDCQAFTSYSHEASETVDRGRVDCAAGLGALSLNPSSRSLTLSNLKPGPALRTCGSLNRARMGRKSCWPWITPTTVSADRMLKFFLLSKRKIKKG